MLHVLIKLEQLLDVTEKILDTEFPFNHHYIVMHLCSFKFSRNSYFDLL